MILSADKNCYDATVMQIFKDVQTPIPIVLITRIDNYEFNPALLDLKEYVLADYCEYEWDKSDFDDTHIFGKNTQNFLYRFPGEQWQIFDNWISRNPPKVYFKRELLKKDATDKIVPSTYPSFQSTYEIQTKEQFDSRPIDVFHYFGRSHEGRMQFHGDAWFYTMKNDIDFVDNLFYLNGFLNHKNKPIWVDVHIPHFSRHSINEILAINGNSKLSLSMPGCGKVCFRHAEASVNSIMVMENNEITFPFEWIDGYNCIKYDGDPLPKIIESLKREDLYDIYVKGQENIDKYRIDSYTRYIEETIQKVL